MTALTVTLGHDGLTADAQSARFQLSDALSTAGEILATFLDGVGQWETNEGETVTETCDAWVVNVSDEVVSDLQSLLRMYATQFGKDALGCIVHGPQFGPSYCEAN